MEYEEVPRHLDSDSEFPLRDPEEVPDVKMETWDPDFGDLLPILEKPRLLEGTSEARQPPIIEWQNELIPVPLPAGEILPDHVIMNSRIVNCEVKDIILANCVVEGCKFYNSKHYIV
ncbi:hypothetical protein L3Y34_016439 [Caenorhabditis briggsae]|nr:hypothetical protein L3Y34_016439 [Caenorhabditis briggsae]